MLDFNTFIFVSVAVIFAIVGLVVWLADSGISDRYKSLLMYFILALTCALVGMFFMIEDDSEFEYAGYQKMTRNAGGQERQSMTANGGGGGSGGGSGGKQESQEQYEEIAPEEPDVTSDQDCEVCPVMVTIAPGMALLGSTHEISSGGLTSGPASQKTITKSFAIGKYEVTVEEFKAFADEMNYTPTGKCQRADGSRGSTTWISPGFAQTPKNPVVCISWADASKYALWLSAKTGKTYRLPTEVEWEYAARAGITRPYMSGDRLQTRIANYRPRLGNGKAGTTPVGTYRANGNGMHDVHGNAWEIVNDCWSRHYQVAAVGETPGTLPIDCSRRIVKGGSWASPLKQTSFPMRGAIPNDMALNAVGFRVMRE